MKNKTSRILSLVAIGIVVVCFAGCQRGVKSSSGSVTSAGREISYSVDGPSSVASTDPLIIQFGGHRLEKQGGNFVLDGRNIGGAGGTDKIEIVVSNSVLTMKSGNNTVTIPIAR